MTSKIECCTQIYNGKDSKSITVEKFLSAPIIEYNNELYTLQNFVFTIAYNGSIHWQPSCEANQPNLNQLYNEVICEISETSLRLIHDIARCLVAAYKGIFEKFNGNNDAYSDVMSRQPMIANKGQLIKDGYGHPTCLFNHSYLQIPIGEQVNYGIRVCLELQMLNTLQQGFIFVCGNRHQKNISLSCEHNLKFLIFKTFSSNRTSLNKAIKIPLNTDMSQKPFTIEMALYKNGYLSIAVNEYLQYCEKIPTNFSIYNGKLIIGANLDGEKFGNFLCSGSSIEAIDTLNVIHTIFMCGMRKLSGCDGLQLPPEIIKRPARR
jgi:hypothetical protein